MSSTNKTAHIGLNQWVLSDPFLMEDMNEDNRRIDAALGQSPWVKLMDITTQQEADSVEINLSGINLSNYLSLRVHVVSNCTRGSINMRINKTTENYYWFFNYGQNWQVASNCYTEGAYVNIDLGAPEIYMGNEMRWTKCSALKPTQITTLDFYESAKIPAGRRYIVMGVRK